MKLNNIAVLSLSSLDHDARIIKTIDFLKKNISPFVYTFSVNSKTTNKYDFSFEYMGHRLLGIPGISLLKLYVLYILMILKSGEKFDVMVCNDLNTLPIGVLFKLVKNKNIKIIYDAHEYETEINGLNGIRKKLTKWQERLLIRYVDKIITVSDSIAKEYTRLYAVPKPYIVLNCPKYQEVTKQNLFRESLEIRSEQVIFLYQGGLSRGRGIETLLDAFSSLESDQYVLVCMGEGPLESLVQKKAKQYSSIFFQPAVSSQILLNYTASADYGIFFYEDTCLNHRYCSPNKIFEYIMAGLPVLTSNLYEIKRLVEDNELGVVAEDNTVKGFTNAVNITLEQDYQKIKFKVEKIRHLYSWEAQEKVLYQVYSNLV